jgi:hypothetical protein
MTNDRILARKVLSRGTGGWIKCCWFECEKPGYELYKSVFHEHARYLPCDHPMAEHVNFVFCSERCRQYYLYSHIDMGNLPAGFKTSL